MSPRPKRHRIVNKPPILRGFKPVGLPMRLTEQVSLLYEEYESIRLADYENLSQEEAAKEMQVSRPTFTRIYESARKKVALAFVKGQSIIFEGGNVEFDSEWYRCNSCHSLFQSVKKKLRKCMNCESEEIENINQSIKEWKSQKYKKGGLGAPEECICPACQKKMIHQPGVPCKEHICPTCKVPMTRI